MVTKSKMCQYCNSNDHSIIKCTELKNLRTEDIVAWIEREKRCWRRVGPHLVVNCNLKKSCSLCNLGVFHQVNHRENDSKVLLKVVKVILRNKPPHLRHLCHLMPPRAWRAKEHLAVRAIRQNTEALDGTLLCWIPKKHSSLKMPSPLISCH